MLYRPALITLFGILIGATTTGPVWATCYSVVADELGPMIIENQVSYPQRVRFTEDLLPGDRIAFEHASGRVEGTYVRSDEKARTITIEADGKETTYALGRWSPWNRLKRALTGESREFNLLARPRDLDSIHFGDLQPGDLVQFRIMGGLFGTARIKEVGVKCRGPMSGPCVHLEGKGWVFTEELFEPGSLFRVGDWSGGKSRGSPVQVIPQDLLPGDHVSIPFKGSQVEGTFLEMRHGKEKTTILLEDEGKVTPYPVETTDVQIDGCTLIDRPRKLEPVHFGSIRVGDLVQFQHNPNYPVVGRVTKIGLCHEGSKSRCLETDRGIEVWEEHVLPGSLFKVGDWRRPR